MHDPQYFETWSDEIDLTFEEIQNVFDAIENEAISEDEAIRKLIDELGEPNNSCEGVYFDDEDCLNSVSNWLQNLTDSCQSAEANKSNESPIVRGGGGSAAVIDDVRNSTDEITSTEGVGSASSPTENADALDECSYDYVDFLAINDKRKFKNVLNKTTTVVKIKSQTDPIRFDHVCEDIVRYIRKSNISNLFTTLKLMRPFSLQTTRMEL